MVKALPCSLYYLQKDQVSYLQESGWHEGKSGRVGKSRPRGDMIPETSSTYGIIIVTDINTETNNINF